MLELRNISFQVPDEKAKNAKEIGILDNVSMTLEDNKFVVITGPNGGASGRRHLTSASAPDTAPEFILTFGWK